MKSLDLAIVNSFLIEKLGLNNWEEEKKDQLKFLRNVVHRYITHPEYAFQNLNLASSLPEERRAPTPDSSIRQCLFTLRGMCIDHNYFLTNLFKSIGYDAFLVASTVSLLPMPMNHPLCIVRVDSELYLVDMGMGSVFHEPIPLHLLPVSFQVGGYRCEYRQGEGGVFQRVHIRGDPVKGDFDVPEEIRYHFTLQPMNYEDFNPAMTEIFTDSSTSFFLNNLYAFRYLTLKNCDAGGDTPKEFEAVIVIGTTLLRFSEKQVQKIVFESYEELEPSFVKYFPAIPLETYREATKYFQTSCGRKEIKLL